MDGYRTWFECVTHDFTCNQMGQNNNNDNNTTDAERKKNKKNDVMLLCPAYCVSRFVLSSFFLPAFVSEILLGHASDAIQFSISTFTTNAPTFLTYSIYNRRVIYICIWPAFVMDHRYPSPVGAAAKEKNFFFF